MFGSKSDPNEIDFPDKYTDSTTRNATDRWYVSSGAVHPDLHCGALSTGLDVAVLTLERGVPSGVATGLDPAKQVQYHLPAYGFEVALQPVTIIGQGLASKPVGDAGPNMVEYGTLRQGPGHISWLDASGQSSNGAGISLRLDEAFLEPTDVVGCGGNSGGPMIWVHDGLERLIAVQSHGGQTCQLASVHTATFSAAVGPFLAQQLGVAYPPEYLSDLGDLDGVPDALDNCRTTQNADQRDKDGDGVGELCDNCPASVAQPPAPGEKWSSHNSDQANCNYEAERAALPGLIRGDACDPTPCAAAEAETEALAATFGVQECQPQQLPAPKMSLCPVSVDTRMRWYGTVIGSGSGKVGEMEVAHCVCPLPHATPAERLANCQVVGAGLRCVSGKAAAFPAQAGADLASGWKAVTTTFGSQQGRNHRYPSKFSYPSSPVLSASWRFEADLDLFGAPHPPQGVSTPQQL
jgi:hypothetical protein